MAVQIFVDNKYRDLWPCLILKKYIETKTSHKVLLSNKRNHFRLYRYYKPEVVILPHAQTYLSHATVNYSKKSKVCLMLTEGGFSKTEVIDMMLRDSVGGKANSSVSKVFAWGNAQANGLREAGLFRDDQIVVSGNPRFELYSKLRSQRKKCSICGIGTTLRYITSIHRYPMVDAIALHSKFGLHDPVRWNQGGIFADYIWFEVASTEIINHFIAEYKNKNNHLVSLRPHPYESMKAYSFIEKKYKIHVDNKEFLPDFLNKLFVYISAFSTSFTDALMAGVPCISYRKLYPKERAGVLLLDSLYNHGPDQFVWQPESFDELHDLVDYARNGSLDLSPDMKKLNNYLYDNYNYGSDKSETADLSEP